jgi:hypothetical protein
LSSAWFFSVVPTTYVSLSSTRYWQRDLADADNDNDDNNNNDNLHPSVGREHPTKKQTTTTTRTRTTTTTTTQILPSLQELTQNPDTIRCDDEDTLPVYDHVVVAAAEKDGGTSTTTGLIPKQIHISFATRCVPRDYHQIIQQWKTGVAGPFRVLS